MVGSIAFNLGAGAGIDTKSLVDDLANAERAPKEALIAKREALNTARVSALAQASNSIDSFATALAKLVEGGSLFTQPTVSDASVLGATALAGNDLGGLSAQIEVCQLAQAQTLASTALASGSTPVGQGELTLTTGLGSFSIVVGAANDSLDGLAKAINDAKAGVTASVIVDRNGARLSLKGATGEANAFTLAVASGSGSGIERFAYDGVSSSGMTLAQAAQDAILRVDGVEVKRAINSLADLVPGVKLDLKKAAPGTIVSLSATRPTADIAQAVDDFVSAYNELYKSLAEMTAASTDGVGGGPLRGDTGIRQMQRQLARLTTVPLSGAGSYSTLAQIGVATNRDGTLRLDSARLQSALDADPSSVEALFNPRQRSDNPAVSILNRTGAVKPGTYVLSGVTLSGGVAAGKVDGVDMLVNGAVLTAPATLSAKGLSVRVDAPAASVTITVDAGLGGALRAIRDSLRANDGPFALAQARLTKEAKSLAEARQAMERRSTVYREQLTTSFTAMDRRVSAFKATQSYLEQQVKIWTADRG